MPSITPSTYKADYLFDDKTYLTSLIYPHNFTEPLRFNSFLYLVSNLFLKCRCNNASKRSPPTYVLA